MYLPPKPAAQHVKNRNKGLTCHDLAARFTVALGVRYPAGIAALSYWRGSWRAN